MVKGRVAARRWHPASFYKVIGRPLVREGANFAKSPQATTPSGRRDKWDSETRRQAPV
jgi:hypothetical protein